MYLYYLWIYIYIYIQGGTELFPRQNFNPRIDASHTILAYSLDCQKRHEGKYEATFFDHFSAGNMEQVPRYDIESWLKGMLPMNTTFCQDLVCYCI